MLIRTPPPWQLRDRDTTPEAAWQNRRELMKALALLPIVAGCEKTVGGLAELQPVGPVPERFEWTLPPVTRDPAWSEVPAGRTLTHEINAASYNNFYEFTTEKDQVWRMAGSLKVRPWTVEVGGACLKPRTFDLEEILTTMPLEERIYRFRCVEAWSMVVPWTGLPLKALLAAVEPTGSAKYVRMVTLGDRKQFPGIAASGWYPWPYHEALTMQEAMNPLAMLAVGIYGHALPNQHGAPIRLVVPWKYGFKNIKSIVRIELTEEQPPTFWNKLVPDEYDFYGNVRPDVPHPRWSQAVERVIPTGERIPTLPWNGYGDQVASMYP